MELGLNSKSVLITGGSKGIGLATARVFAAEGAAIRLASRSRTALEEARDEIRRDFAVPVEIYPGNLSNGDTARDLVGQCADVDILVNNAGAIPLGTIEEIDEPTWREAWNLKLFGYINTTRAMYGEMKARRGGVIVNNIGTAGNQKSSLYACGVTANGGLITLTRALGGTSLEDGIRVVGVSPGDMANERGEMALRRQAGRTGIRRSRPLA